MIELIISFLLYLLAIASKSIADTIHHHPKTMIFKGNFWKMWPHDNGYYPFTKIPKDGWHTFNGLMICFLTAIPFVQLFRFFHWGIVCSGYALAGIIWILGFNLLYNKTFQNGKNKKNNG